MLAGKKWDERILIDHENGNSTCQAVGCCRVRARGRRDEADSSYWRYECDLLGKVTHGAKYWGDQTPVAGQQFEYGFDDIGNRTSTKAGGDSSGSSASLRSAMYVAKTFKQNTSRTAPNAFKVLGDSQTI